MKILFSLIFPTKTFKNSEKSIFVRLTKLLQMQCYFENLFLCMVVGRVLALPCLYWVDLSLCSGNLYPSGMIFIPNKAHPQKMTFVWFFAVDLKVCYFFHLLLFQTPKYILMTKYHIKFVWIKKNKLEHFLLFCYFF